MSTIVIEVLKGSPGSCLIINSTRVCGSKPAAVDGKVLHKWFGMDKDRILSALGMKGAEPVPKWSVKTPTRPGFYFYRVDPDCITEVVTVYYDEDEKQLMFRTTDDPARGNWFANAGDCCEWAGPIKEPV